MNYRFASLVAFEAEHGYYAGSDLSFLTWQPTPATLATLARWRLLHRPTPNGGVILYETDPARPGAVPLLGLEPDITLTFIGRVVHDAFPGVTEPPPEPGRPFFFSNRSGQLTAGVGRPHSGAFAAADDQVRLASPRLTLRRGGLAGDIALEVADSRGTVLLRRTLVPDAGSVETAVDLTPWVPGCFEVRWGDGLRERLYADAGLSGEAPAALLELVLRPDGPGGFALVDEDGEPVEEGLVVRPRWQERATVWRYVVVPRTDPDVDPADIRVRHVPDAGAAFLFASAGTLPPSTGEGGAVLFESTTRIGLRAVPYRGLQLQTRAAADAEYVSVVSDLPNPRPGSLSLASTSGRPVSEVFVYL